MSFSEVAFAFLTDSLPATKPSAALMDADNRKLLKWIIEVIIEVHVDILAAKAQTVFGLSPEIKKSSKS